MTQDRQKIKDKISKLLAKAEKTDNIHEAGAFMAAVNNLLEQHQIEMHELKLDNDPMGHQDGEFNVYASMMWARMTIHSIARYYGARVVWKQKRRNHLPYTVYGKESARMTAELMIPYIVSQVRQQAKVYMEEQGRTWSGRKLTASIAQREVGTALSSRIEKMLHVVEERRHELEANALVPVNDVQTYIDNVNPGTRKLGGGKSYSRTANDFAEKISLSHQATSAGHVQIGN